MLASSWRLPKQIEYHVTAVALYPRRHVESRFIAHSRRILYASLAIMYHDWSRRSFLQLLSVAVAAGRAGVRAGCQTRCYGEPPRTLAGLLPLVADMAD